MAMQNAASHWRLKLYITMRRIFLITKRQFCELLNFLLQSPTRIKRMKNQAVVFLVSFLLIAALLPKSDSFGGPVPSGKRELQGKVGFCYVWWFFVVASHCVVAKTVQNFLQTLSYNTSFTSVYYLNIVSYQCTPNDQHGFLIWTQNDPQGYVEKKDRYMVQWLNITFQKITKAKQE